MNLRAEGGGFPASCWHWFVRRMKVLALTVTEKPEIDYRLFFSIPEGVFFFFNCSPERKLSV